VCYINHNGKFIKEDEPIITANSRALRYGDGLFETMKILNGRLQLSNYHFDRLFHSLRLFQFQLPKLFTAAFIEKQIIELAQKNQHLQHGRIRLSILRGNGGLYDAHDHFPNYLIQTWQLPQPNNQLNQNGLVTGLYTGALKTTDSFSNCKHNNYLPYVMGALYAKQMKWNDAVILNQHGRVCDATIANIFIIKNEKIYTPPLSEGCVAGTIRRYLVEDKNLHFTIQEKQLTISDIENATEVFLTNAIYGLRWVQSFNEVGYSCNISSRIYQQLTNALVQF
jgi:branched-chain amino acid aminotransferase